MKTNKIYFAIITAFILCSCSKPMPTSVLDLVPAESFLVLDANRPSALHELFLSLSESTDVIQNIDNQLNGIDSLWAGDEAWQLRFRDAQTALALAMFQDSIVEFMVFDLGKSLSNRKLYDIIKSKGLDIEMLQTSGLEYLKIIGSDTLFAFTQNRFLVMASNGAFLPVVHRRFSNPDACFLNDGFSKVQATVGSSIPVHLYLNYTQLEPIVVANAALKHSETASKFASVFKGLAALDVLPKPDGLVLNGYSTASDSVSFLRLLKYQRPTHNSVVNVLPYHTKIMLHYGMSDYASYWEEFVDNKEVESVNKRFGIDVGTQFVGGLSEVSYCVFGTSVQPVFVGRMNDPSRVIQFMMHIGERFGVSESVVVQGYTLNRLKVNNFVPSVFGEGFKGLTSCCYSIVDQYLLIANDFIPIQEVISCYRSGRTLDLSENFKAFQNNMLESANISLYVACADNQSVIRKFVASDLAEFLDRNPSFLKGYQAFSVQFASAKDLVYSCFNLRKATDIKEESNVQWRVNLDAPLKGKPFLISEDASNAVQVVAFDVNDMMYLIDSHGNVKWKKQIEEAPLSDINVVDYYRNGSSQLFFNTANYLELVDFEGNSISGFPKRFQVEASNGLTVIDYDGNKNYRVLFCGVDKFVYNSDLDGDETLGWNRHRTEGLVVEPVQHLVADNKDFVIATDEAGVVRILDRQGRIRIPLPTDFHKSQGAVFYENRTNHKGVILTADDVGNLLYIANDGGLARTEFGQFTRDHFFLYEDFDGDNNPDFIYLDGKELRVFNRFKKALFSHDFDTEITTKPVFLRISRNKHMLAVVSEAAREVYLIDMKGNVTVSSGLVGDSGFAIGSLKGNNEINLLTGADNCLFNYLIY